MNLSALDEDGKPVDWWFAYKLPTLPLPARPLISKANYQKMSQDEQKQYDEERKTYDEARRQSLGAAQGVEYLYCDAVRPALPFSLSPHTNILESGALVNTIQQLRDAAVKQDPQVGWFSYNDEFPKYKRKPIPGLPADGWDFGHTKGVLAFDLETDTAFWLLHSWPCYPTISYSPVDDPSLLFGQTFLCITLQGILTADEIARVFHEQSQPQIIDKNLPVAIDVGKYPNLVQLAKDAPPTPVPLGSSTPSDTTFTSKNGTQFRLFAKSKDWKVPSTDKVQESKDLYSDLIGPTLGVNLEVETWLLGGESDTDSDTNHTTQDIQWIDLEPLGLNYAWNFLYHDHAKWAVSMDLDKQAETDWVIVADINRIDTQYKRGGVGIAFQNQVLAHSLHSIIKMAPPMEPLRPKTR
jgi:deoxyribonuclease-2